MQCFVGTVFDDGVPGEGPETFNIEITSVGPEGVQISRDTTVITITDTDREWFAISNTHTHTHTQISYAIKILFL